MSAAIELPFSRFAIEDPWEIPPRAERQQLTRATDGRAPRLETIVAAFRDESSLVFIIQGRDDGIVATYLAHDDPLYREDVVEVFLAPRTIAEYYEFEVSPIGATFDVRIESPDGVRATMRSFLDWDCDGLFAAVRRTPESIDVAIRIPFASLGVAPSASGDEWRANFFRIDRHSTHGDEFLAWSPTMKNPPDFHVTAAFGVLRFA